MWLHYAWYAIWRLSYFFNGDIIFFSQSTHDFPSFPSSLQCTFLNLLPLVCAETVEISIFEFDDKPSDGSEWRFVIAPSPAPMPAAPTQAHPLQQPNRAAADARNFRHDSERIFSAALASQARTIVRSSPVPCNVLNQLLLFGEPRDDLPPELRLFDCRNPPPILDTMLHAPRRDSAHSAQHSYDDELSHFYTDVLHCVTDDCMLLSRVVWLSTGVERGLRLLSARFFLLCFSSDDSCPARCDCYTDSALRRASMELSLVQVSTPQVRTIFMISVVCWSVLCRCAYIALSW